MNNLEKQERYASIRKSLSNDLSNIFMDVFTPMMDKYEQFVKDVHELYPDLNSDMVEDIMLQTIESEFTSHQYDIFTSLFERIKEAGIPYWGSCKPWDCETCALKCEFRLRDERK